MFPFRNLSFVRTMDDNQPPNDLYGPKYSGPHILIIFIFLIVVNLVIIIRTFIELTILYVSIRIIFLIVVNLVIEFRLILDRAQTPLIHIILNTIFIIFLVVVNLNIGCVCLKFGLNCLLGNTARNLRIWSLRDHMNNKQQQMYPSQSH